MKNSGLPGRGLPQDAQGRDRLRRAIRHSSFRVLAAGGAKRERGFVERARGADDFFRRGRTGTWREELTPRQVEIISRPPPALATTGR
ncbi:MAG: hypothetical protein ACXW3P_08315 [Rhodospirillales bacterium]